MMALLPAFRAAAISAAIAPISVGPSKLYGHREDGDQPPFLTPNDDVLHTLSPSISAGRVGQDALETGIQLARDCRDALVPELAEQ